MAEKYWDDGSANGNLSTAANYDSDTSPSSGDNLTFEEGATDITLGLTALSNTTLSGNLALLRISAAFTNNFGTASAYAEIGADAAEIGYWNRQAQLPAGSPRIKIDFGSQATKCRVRRTATTNTDANQEPAQLLFNSGTATCSVYGPSRVGVATANPAETSQLGTVSVYDAESRFTGGPGLTLATLDGYGGMSVLHKVATTVNARGGIVQVRAASGTITTARGFAGTLDLRGAGVTVTNAIELYDGATLDLRGFVGTINDIKMMESGKVTIRTDAGVTI